MKTIAIPKNQKVRHKVIRFIRSNEFTNVFEIDETIVLEKPQEQKEVKREWPIYAKILKRFKTDGETGVGDTFKRLVDTKASIVNKIIKRYRLRCRCPQRRDDWNRLYPYK